jgi:alcohol dehydrogenase (cytochrome c)
VRSASANEISSVATGLPWSGSPDGFGKQDDTRQWAGWLTATDADSGKQRWKFKAPFPLMGGITPTSGGLVFFGDMGGNFYALDAATGQKLWGKKIGGAIGGGVITYAVNGAQKVAVATGYVSPAFPAEVRRAQIAILGLEGGQ